MATYEESGDFIMKAVFHYDQLEHGRIITTDIYYQQLHWMNGTLCRKYSGLGNRKGVMFQYHTVRTHSAKQV